MEQIDLENHDEAMSLSVLISNLGGAPGAITTQAQYEDVADQLLEAKRLLSESDRIRKSITSPMDAEKKRVMTWFKESFDTRLQEQVDACTAALKVYQDEQRRLAEEAARQAQKAAEKERERKQKLADKAVERGDEERAAEHQAAADATVADVSSISAQPQAQGIHARDNWKFEITDETLLPRTYLQPDLQKIRKVVQALKSDAEIPGVHVYNDPSVVARQG